MTKSQVLKKTRDYVRKILDKEATGHDWYHIERVVRNAKLIGKQENVRLGSNSKSRRADLFIVELGALLHDVADWKFHSDPDAGVKVTVKLLASLKVQKPIIDQVAYIVQNISFKGGANKHKMSTVEGRVVQDADRLDALGAIGIARAFAYGGHRGKPIHDPKIPLMNIQGKKDLSKYRDKGTTINHFYEKILWLRDLMNTKAGYKLAGEREKFIKQFLKQFYKEWEGQV